ncbi:MAG: ribosome maturation factor RimM [Thermodesulfobacteriota bacterium]
MSKGAPSPPHLIALGRVVGAHGIRGAVKIGTGGPGEAADPEIFTALGEVEIGGSRYRVKKAERHRRQVLLYLQGIDDRDQAELLVGQEVRGERQRFPALPPGEYYWFQVLGLPVFHAAEGTPLGYLEEIIPSPAHDVYVVRWEGKEVLLPAIEEVIVEINLEEGWIKVLPPAGLWEVYAD